MRLAILLVGVGCGRVGFDGVASDGGDALTGGAARWTRIAAGGAHTCGLDRDQRLSCWGRNVDGELGRSSTSSIVSAPGTLDGLWTDVAATGSTTCALRESGALACWGNNAYGQVGDDSTNDRNTPVLISTDSWLDVAVGTGHVCAIRSDGTIACWGNNENGELGNGTLAPHRVPMPIAGATKFRAVTVGNAMTCAISEGNELYCWGLNDRDVFSASTPSQSTMPVPIGGEQWNQIAIGYSVGCGITMAGALRCWGNNSHGQVGDGTQFDRTAPTAVNVPDLAWVQVSVAARTACARSSDGRVFCWGDSTMGQTLAYDDSVATPREITGNGPWLDVTVGEGHVCVLGPDALYCAGKNGFGQLGDGGTSASVPALVPGKWSSVSTGIGFTCGIRTDGTVSCAGRNESGQLGTGDRVETMVMTPTATSLLDGALRVSAGVEHACAQNGTSIYCWGANYRFQLGLPDGIDRITPTLVTTGSLPSSRMHTCMVASGTSRPTCWGANERLQINATAADVTMPFEVSSVVQVSAIAAGRFHTCVIDSTGALFCLGDGNAVGQSPPPTSSSMLRFTGLTGISSLAAGGYHTCAVATNGTGSCWGAGYAGQLGQGDTSARFSPATLPGTWSMLSGGEIHTCGIRTDGSLACWGDNTFGQLGTSSANNTTSPALVAAGPWRSVSASALHTCAITTTDDLYCWGNNNDGELALGTAWRGELVAIP